MIALLQHSGILYIKSTSGKYENNLTYKKKVIHFKLSIRIIKHLNLSHNITSTKHISGKKGTMLTK